MAGWDALRQAPWDRSIPGRRGRRWRARSAGARGDRTRRGDPGHPRGAGRGGARAPCRVDDRRRHGSGARSGRPERRRGSRVRGESRRSCPAWSSERSSWASTSCREPSRRPRSSVLTRWGCPPSSCSPPSLGGPSYLRALRGPLRPCAARPDRRHRDRGGRGIPRRRRGVRGARRRARRRATSRERRGARRDRRRGRAAAIAAIADRAVTGPPDVIAVGETMLSLVALNGPLDEATSFHATHGGAESNTCVALARLGTSAAWVSRCRRGPDGGSDPRRARSRRGASSHG